MTVTRTVSIRSTVAARTGTSPLSAARLLRIELARSGEPSRPSLAERVLALAAGKTRRELYLACPKDRPNVIGMAVQRHIRAGRIAERDGKLYASPAAQKQAHAAV